MPLNDEAIRKLLDEATPGPWAAVGEDQFCVEVADGRDYGGQTVCDCAESHSIWKNYQSGPDNHGEANARLIAAAPDLAQIALDRGDEIARLREERDALSARLGEAEARERKLQKMVKDAFLEGVFLAAQGDADA